MQKVSSKDKWVTLPSGEVLELIFLVYPSFLEKDSSLVGFFFHIIYLFVD